jgi:hypothetical protein
MIGLIACQITEKIISVARGNTHATITAVLLLLSLAVSSCANEPDGSFNSSLAGQQFLYQLSGGNIKGKASGPQASVTPGQPASYQTMKKIQFQCSQEVATATANDTGYQAGQQLGAGLAFGTGLAPYSPPWMNEPASANQLRTNKLVLISQCYQRRGLIGVPPILNAEPVS